MRIVFAENYLAYKGCRLVPRLKLSEGRAVASRRRLGKMGKDDVGDAFLNRNMAAISN